MSRRRAVLLLLTACLLQACGLGPGEVQEGAGVELRITRDFGQRAIDSAQLDEVRSSDTVMRLLRAEVPSVKTTYGGRFVQSIGELEGAGAEGNFDWFFYVNGRVGGESAADTAIHPGDVVQWDYRDWRGAMYAFAIVGAYPEPFVHGFEGERLPTRVACAVPEGPACETVKERLASAGVTVTGAPLGAPAGRETLRVLVGTWSALRDLRVSSALEQPPSESGVFARFSPDGSELALFDPAGEPVRISRGGLVAAVAAPDEAPTWFVTGIEAEDVEAAAELLDSESLESLFAVAVENGRAVPLPVASRKR